MVGKIQLNPILLKGKTFMKLNNPNCSEITVIALMVTAVNAGSFLTISFVIYFLKNANAIKTIVGG